MTVRLQNLTVRYGSKTAVEDLTVAFGRSPIGLLGRNGAGKSSVFKALLGLVKPASGSFVIDAVPQGTEQRSLHRFVGYMPESDAYFPGMTGYESVLLAARISGLTSSVAARKSHEMLWKVGLDEQRYRRVAGYSAGMRQKVRLAQALVHDPCVLFLDEPTNGLDPEGRVEMLALVRRLGTEANRVLVLSTHILQDVESACESVVVLDHGKLVLAGDVADLTRGLGHEFDLVLDADDALAAFTARATAELTAHPTIDLLATPRAGEFIIKLPSASAVELFTIVHRAGAVVRRFVERRKSLEDLFLGAIAPSDAASSGSGENDRAEAAS